MSTTTLSWMFFRCLRWAFWLATAAYYLECGLHRADHVSQFGLLMPMTEFWLFGLPIAAVFAGFMEMMLRERAGLDRPNLLGDWLGRPKTSLDDKVPS